MYRKSLPDEDSETANITKMCVYLKFKDVKFYVVPNMEQPHGEYIFRNLWDTI